MSDDTTIPPEALEAAARKLWLARKELFGPAFPRKTWEELSIEKRAELLEEARAACIAMLRAWPGMAVKGYYEGLNNTPSRREVILPLPQEASDD